MTEGLNACKMFFLCKKETLNSDENQIPNAVSEAFSPGLKLCPWSLAKRIAGNGGESFFMQILKHGFSA